MNQFKKISKHALFSKVAVFFVITIGLLLLVVSASTKSSSSDIRSRASRDAFLTQQDDVLSLQEDLERLSVDPVAEDMMLLETVE